MAFTARAEQMARGSSLSSPYSYTITKATDVADGDIMFMFLQVYLASAAPTIDSAAADWQQVATNSTTYSRWYLYYKIASGEGANYTWSLSASCRYYALNIAYTAGDFNVASLTDITAISNTAYATAGAAVRGAAMSVPHQNSPLVYFASVYNTTARTFTPPSTPVNSWSEDSEQGHTTPDISMTNGSLIWLSSGNTGDMDITCSTSITTQKHAFVIALRPFIRFATPWLKVTS